MATTEDTGNAPEAQRADPRQAGGVLSPGTPAPDFRLSASPDVKVGLSDFKGRNLIIMFYPADWSPVCSDEVVVFNELLPEFKRHNAEVVGISVDGVWSHLAFERDRHLSYPLLADFEPKGQVSRAFGAYRHDEGVSERALFVLDGEGVVRWSHLSPDRINPGADGVLSALEQITGQATFDADISPTRQEGGPETTRPGDPTRFGRTDTSRQSRREQEASHGKHRTTPDAHSTGQ